MLIMPDNNSIKIVAVKDEGTICILGMRRINKTIKLIK